MEIIRARLEPLGVIVSDDDLVLQVLEGLPKENDMIGLENQPIGPICLQLVLVFAYFGSLSLAAIFSIVSREDHLFSNFWMAVNIAAIISGFANYILILMVAIQTYAYWKQWKSKEL